MAIINVQEIGKDRNASDRVGGGAGYERSYTRSWLIQTDDVIRGPGKIATDALASWGIPKVGSFYVEPLSALETTRPH